MNVILTFSPWRCVCVFVYLTYRPTWMPSQLIRKMLMMTSGQEKPPEVEARSHTPKNNGTEFKMYILCVKLRDLEYIGQLLNVAREIL